MPICDYCGAAPGSRIVAGPLELSFGPPRASWNGKRLRLTQSQLRILILLLKRGALAREALADEVLGPRTGPKCLDVHLSYLRDRLEPLEGGGRQLIRTITGWGFEWTGERPRLVKD